MPFSRATGILLHPTSLPSRGGVGDFGPAAYEFLDFLSAAQQGLWQVLPLGPPAVCNSPYSSTSAFAGNPLLISLERLAEKGWLDSSRLSQPPKNGSHVDFDAVWAFKQPLLREAATNFLAKAQGPARTAFDRFVSENLWWLEDFALFDVLRNKFPGQLWNQWPSDLAHRDLQALAKVRKEFAKELDTRRVIQFFFYEQWKALRRYCADRRIRVVGDIAIFVDYDSADVWANRELFRLKEDLSPEVVSGVPPDAFSETGQRWGNPLYDWDAMRERGYTWWINRLRWATQTCDYIRLDHFRGFEQFWEIPADEPTAVNGKWVDGPKDELFMKLKEELGGLPFFAEDLGFITPEVHELRERHDIPGMAVLQFGFSNPGAHIYLPHKLEKDCVVYTGTHDNDTTLGWWETAPEEERRAVQCYVGDSDDGIHWALIRLAQSSVANLSVVPVQDVLGLGTEARLNVPSVKDGNFAWRLTPGLLTLELAGKLSKLVEMTDRVPEEIAVQETEEAFA